MSNRLTVQSEARNENEDKSTQPGALQGQQRGHSNVKQLNEIVLKQSADEEGTDGGVAELQHLLSGHQKANRQQQQQQLLLQPSARVEHGAASVANNDVIPLHSAARMTQYNSSNNYGKSNNNGSSNNNGNSNSHTNNTASHSQLDIQKFPPEMQYDEQQQQQQPNGTTIILAPTSLNATTATTATAGALTPPPLPATTASTYKGPKIWRHLVQHWPIISQPLAIFIVFLMLWTIGYILLPQYAHPGTGIMRIAFLFVGAQISGILVTFLRLPDMLGMLFFGVLYTNVGLADFTGYQPLEAVLREMALINIMLLAGLGLDWTAFKRLWLMILRLTLVPTIAEVTIIAVLARFLLNMPWLWGILLGLVVTAVSPNVVVTVMLKLKEERLGLNSGIHTLIYAMTTCNDVVAIFVFGVILGVIFSTGTLTDQILQGPIGIGIGVVFGYVYGLMLQFVPSRKSTYVNGLRFVLTILGGTIAVMGSKFIGYTSAGALGCVAVAFFAGIGWKRDQQQLSKQQQQHAANDNSSVAKRLDLLWKFLKPVSFALIGKEIHFAVLDGKVVGYGLLLVLLGSLFRLGFAYISTYGGNLSRKERAYITISGFPKATVQAALGPIALDLARSLNADAENLLLANNLLIISVLAIIFTAPIGAILMLRLAPRWLQYSPPDEDADTANGMRNNDNVMNLSKSDAQNHKYNGNKSLNFDVDPAVGATNDARVDDTEATSPVRHLV